MEFTPKRDKKKKPDKHARLSLEDRQEYENSLKITKTPKRYALRSRPYKIL